ncbi:uncharacterized protein LOC119456399 [Dermacentor silvarum]|uniref:uncharacterized protein LOC119456399 n=1 Tax=Dermacentor silvarum TaxID=543639 RepID=UPI002101D128|nr:uncharacterized protein LOC119456399 [Dermacentor silvarum]
MRTSGFAPPFRPLDFVGSSRSAFSTTPLPKTVVLDAAWTNLSPSTSTLRSTIKEQSIPVAPCGLGGCAQTQTANPFTLVMQVFQRALVRLLLPSLVTASLAVPLQYRAWSGEHDRIACHPSLMRTSGFAPPFRPLDFVGSSRSAFSTTPLPKTVVLDAAWTNLSPSTSTLRSTIKEQSIPVAPCGLGGCAQTQTANPFTLVMQVSKAYSLFSKKSSNRFLLQLPSPHCCLLVAVECSDVIRALLMMSGDVESNPGPDSDALLAELKNLSAGQSQLISQVQDLKTHLVSTDKAIADLGRRMTDLEGHYQNLVSLRSDFETVKTCTAQVATVVHKLETRIDDAENQSRRNNLIFYGLPESTGSETFAQTEQRIIKHCQDHLNICIEPKEIERAHRLGHRTDTNRHRPIIAKFTFHKTKELVLSNGRKFKGTSFSVGEDFSRSVQNARRHLVTFAKSKSLPFSLRFKTLHMGHKRYVYDEQTQSVKEII